MKTWAINWPNFEIDVFDYPSQARGFIEDILPHALDLLLAKIEKGEEQCIVK